MSYLDLVARGTRAGYIRLAVDERLERVRAGLALLRLARSDEEIVYLIEAADLPSARIAETGLLELRPDERSAVERLWAESEASGLGGERLLAALDSGRGA